MPRTRNYVLNLYQYQYASVLLTTITAYRWRLFNPGPGVLKPAEVPRPAVRTTFASALKCFLTPLRKAIRPMWLH